MSRTTGIATSIGEGEETCSLTRVINVWHRLDISKLKRQEQGLPDQHEIVKAESGFPEECGKYINSLLYAVLMLRCKLNVLNWKMITKFVIKNILWSYNAKTFNILLQCLTEHNPAIFYDDVSILCVHKYVCAYWYTYGCHIWFQKMAISYWRCLQCQCNINSILRGHIWREIANIGRLRKKMQ